MHSERRPRFLVLATAIAVAGGLPACGGFVESGDDVTRVTLGAEGGTLTVGEFALVVPPHALDHTVTLSGRREVRDAPAGRAFTVTSTSLVSFPSPSAEVTLAYDAAVHMHPADVHAAILASGVWHQLTRPAGDPGTAGIARGVTTELGTFGVIDCPGGVCP